MNIFDLLIVQPIFNLLIGLYSIIPGGDFGVSLIIFTVLVRFALYPLIKKQLHQTQAMKKLQPSAPGRGRVCPTAGRRPEFGPW